MFKPWRTWFFHNVVAHPLCEIVYWLLRPLGRYRAESASSLIHDATLPHDRSTNDRRV